MERDNTDSSIFMNDDLEIVMLFKNDPDGPNICTKMLFSRIYKTKPFYVTRTRWTNGAMFVNNTTDINLELDYN